MGRADAQVIGALDPEFGLVQVDVAPGSADHANSLVVQVDGRILLGGMARLGTNSQVSLLRFLPNGELDDTFGDGGIRLHDLGGSGERCTTVLLQPDGRIIAVGDLTTDHQFGFAARYLPDGLLDVTYGENGLRMFQFSTNGNSAINDAALHPDGRLVITGTYITSAGDARMAVARLTADGSLDATFSGSGVRVLPAGTDRRAFAVVIAPDGGIVLGGKAELSANDTRTCLMKVTGNGEIDASFGSGGTVLLEMDSDGSEANDLHITNLDGLLIGGTRDDGTHKRPFGAKLLANGAVDPAFTITGLWTYNVALGGSVDLEAIAEQADGAIVGCAITSTVAPYLISLFRRRPTGEADQGFGIEAYGWLHPSQEYDFIKGDMVLLPDGSILVAGGLTGANSNSITFLMKCVNNPELGIRDANTAGSMLIQPNPFTDHISFSSDLEADGYIIRDVLGRALKQGELERSTERGRCIVRDIPPMLASPLILHLTKRGHFVAASIILQE